MRFLTSSFCVSILVCKAWAGGPPARMIANQDGPVYSTRCSAAYAVYREVQWQRRSKHTELES